MTCVQYKQPYPLLQTLFSSPLVSFLSSLKISWRLSDEPVAPDEREDRLDPEVRRNTKCTIYLSYTSNMISSGIRETICFLVKHKLVGTVVGE